jgi:hypothetical protein
VIKIWLVAILLLFGCDNSRWVVVDTISSVTLDWNLTKGGCELALGQVVLKNRFYVEHPERLKCIHKDLEDVND